jgi:hypothetical protein
MAIGKDIPVYLQSGDPEKEHTPTLHASGLLGATFTITQPHRSPPGPEDGRQKGYRLVQTDSTMSVAPYKGAVAWWADKARYLVTTAATNRNRIAGTFQNAPPDNIAPGEYCCVQIKGPASVKLLDADMAAVAIGDFIIPSSTAGKATRVAVGTAPTHATLGQVAGPALSTTPAEALVVVDLNVDDTF